MRRLNKSRDAEKRPAPAPIQNKTGQENQKTGECRERPVRRMTGVLVMLIAFCFSSLYAEDFFFIKQEIIENAWKRASIFYLTPILNMNRLGYNSNIHIFDHLESPDLSANIGLDLDIAVIAKNRFIFKVKEYPSYSLFYDNDGERAFNNILNFTGYTWLGRFNFKYHFEHHYVHDRVNPEVGWQMRRYETLHLFSIDYGDMTNFFVNLYGRQRKLSYSDELYLDSFNMDNLFGRTEYWLGLSANKIIFSRSQLQFLVEYFDHQYRVTTTRSRTGIQGSLGLILPAGSVTGVLRAGLRYIRPNSRLYLDFYRAFGSGSVSLRLSNRLFMRVEYLLENRYSYGGEDLYYDSESVGGGITYMFTPRFRLGYHYRWGRRSYMLLGTNIEPRRDYYDSSSILLIMNRAGKTEIGLEYRIYHTDSSSLRFDGRYDFIGGYITHEF
ncbi:MAG: hypothetical protein GY765_33215 [bacterium]|nr:hypothetical protein [bacterium]